MIKEGVLARQRWRAGSRQRLLSDGRRCRGSRRLAQLSGLGRRAPPCLWRCSIRPVGGCDRWGVPWRATGPVTAN